MKSSTYGELTLKTSTLTYCYEFCWTSCSIEWIFLMIDRNFRKYCHCAQFPCQNIATCRHLNFGRFAISITSRKWNSNKMSQLLSILGFFLQAYQFHVFKWVLLLLNVHTKNQTCFVRNFWIFVSVQVYCYFPLPVSCKHIAWSKTFFLICFIQ